MTVTGIPTRQYSIRLIDVPCLRAFSTTIKFATDPKIVKFPAKVLDMAKASHAVS